MILPEVEPDSLEAETRQLFNIVLNVYVKGLVGGPRKVGFVRMKAIDVWGFRNEPEWHPLQGYINKSTGFTKLKGSCWSVRTLGPKSDLTKLKRRKRSDIRDYTPTPWDKTAPTKPLSIPYQLRAYIYQARNLACSSNAALPSPFVKVSLVGHEAELVCAQPARYDQWKSLSR